MSPDEILVLGTYAIIGLAIYTYIRDILPDRVMRWVNWALIGLLLLLILYWVWSSYFAPTEALDQDAIDNPNDVTTTNDDKPKLVPQVQNTYLEQLKDFALTEKLDLNSPVGSQVTYEQFKRWFLVPEFLNKFTDARRRSLRIIRSRLLSVKRETLKTHNTLSSDKTLSLDRVSKGDMTNMTLSRIDDLLNEIKVLEKSITIETTRRNLIRAINDPENGIESLTGRQNIKDYLALQLYTFAQNPRIFSSNFQNIALYGSAGIGKTKVAKVIGHVYALSGIIVRNDVLITTKQSFTTAYVNESGRKTLKVLLSYLGGVIFIDEAYDLAPPVNVLGRTADHGHEAITEIVNFIDKMIGLSIIIVAGYKEEMETRFMSANEGLSRRFPHVLTLKEYDSKELTRILIQFLLATCPDLKFDEEHGNYLYTLIKNIYKDDPKVFQNQAGDMANLSGFISRAIYGSIGKQWPGDYERLLMDGVNSYLGEKGLVLEELD